LKTGQRFSKRLPFHLPPSRQMKNQNPLCFLPLCPLCLRGSNFLVFYDPSVLEEDTRGKQGFMSKSNSMYLCVICGKIKF